MTNPYIVFVAASAADPAHIWWEAKYARGGDGLGGKYDFSKMPLDPSGSSTVEQRRMVGTLCFDCGITENMLYSPGSYIGGMSEWAEFGYCSVLAPLYSNMNALLDAGCPIATWLYSNQEGYSDIPLGSNAVVVDGYGIFPDASTYYYHINMSNYGTYDAWYALRLVAPGWPRSMMITE